MWMADLLQCVVQTTANKVREPAPDCVHAHDNPFEGWLIWRVCLGQRTASTDADVGELVAVAGFPLRSTV